MVKHLLFILTGVLGLVVVSAQAERICFMDKLYDGTQVRRCMDRSQYNDFRFQQKFNKQMMNGIQKKLNPTPSSFCKRAKKNVESGMVAFRHSSAKVSKQTSNIRQRRKMLKPAAQKLLRKISTYKKVCRNMHLTRQYAQVLQMEDMLKKVR